jgi:HEAT repeat protein
MGVRAVGAWAALAVALWGGAAAAAARKPRAGAGAGAAAKGVPTLSASRLEGVRGLLLGDDEAASLEAAKALGASAAGNAADPLVDLLAAGTTAPRAAAALDALAKLGEVGALASSSAATFEVLELYAGNRTPDLRQRAVKALGSMRGDARVVPTLMARLGDAAPNVRATAGEALAARRELKAAPRLLALVKKSDPGAAGPLAALATPDLVPHIAELAGSVDEGVLATALGEYAKRGDVSDKLRVDVLRTVANLPGAAATTALVEYIASVPAKEDRPSKKEAQKLLDERGTKE